MKNTESSFLKKILIFKMKHRIIAPILIGAIVFSMIFIGNLGLKRSSFLIGNMKLLYQENVSYSLRDEILKL